MDAGGMGGGRPGRRQWTGPSAGRQQGASPFGAPGCLAYSAHSPSLWARVQPISGSRTAVSRPAFVRARMVRDPSWFAWNRRGFVAFGVAQLPSRARGETAMGPRSAARRAGRAPPASPPRDARLASRLPQLPSSAGTTASRMHIKQFSNERGHRSECHTLTTAQWAPSARPAARRRQSRRRHQSRRHQSRRRRYPHRRRRLPGCCRECQGSCGCRRPGRRGLWAPLAQWGPDSRPARRQGRHQRWGEGQGCSRDGRTASAAARAAAHAGGSS